MKYKYNYILIIIIAILLTNCNGKQDRDRQLSYSIDGPYSRSDIMSEFNIDSISAEIFLDDYFTLTIENNTNLSVSIPTNKENRIFPYSSHLHTFNPYSAIERKWSKYSYPSELSEMSIDSILVRGKYSKFWFGSFYDELTDTLYSHFELRYPSKEIFNRTFSKSFQQKQKPNIAYQLKEISKSIKHNEGIEISVSTEGPLTYEETNRKLNIAIQYIDESEEVFIVTINNKGKDTIYIEAWPNNEIKMDTLISYNTSSQSTTEKTWYQAIYNKKNPPSDTVQIIPENESRFWFYFKEMRPQIDSIAFEKSIKTEKLDITSYDQGMPPSSALPI